MALRMGATCLATVASWPMAIVLLGVVWPLVSLAVALFALRTYYKWIFALNFAGHDLLWILNCLFRNKPVFNCKQSAA